MAFTSQLGTIDSVLGATQQMAGSDAPPPSGDQNVNASNTIFGDANDNLAVYDPVFNVFISQRIFGGDGQTLTSNYLEVSNKIFVTGQQLGLDVVIDVVQYLGFTDRVFAPDVGNHFGFSDKAAPATIVSAANFMFTNPTNDNKVIRAYNASNAIGFVDVVTTSVPINVAQSLGFVQTITSTGPSERTLGDSGFLRQHVSFTISDNKCREQEYDPLIGEGDNELGALQIAPPEITTGTLTLTFPADNPTTTLVLENPEFGNTDTLTFTRIDRDTVGGVRKIFSDPKWAQWERIELSITGLCGVETDEILAFLNASLGKEIRLADWEGQSWRGFIVTPGTEVTEGSDGWAFRMTFEGSISVQAVQHGLSAVVHGADQVVYIL